ncbi:MAG: hypothetical protein JJE25_09365, partial [Bacteroidia bacterium]|nr:hypothetical protein [Bacteroidia bacterium]
MKASFNYDRLSQMALATFIYSSFLFSMLNSNAQSSSQGNNNGNTFTTVAIAGSSSTWLNTSNVSVADNVYSVNGSNLPATGNYTNYLVVTEFGFSIPAGNNIDGIKVSVTRREDNSEVKDYRLRLLKSNIIGTTDRISSVAWPTTNSTRAYGSSTDLWGDTWTLSDINSTGFGVAIAVQRVVGGAFPVAARIDNIRITVYYSTTPAPLPVELISFNASANENQVSLNWQTASEINNNYFTLEKSQDGTNYQSIRTVKGAGNTNVAQSYFYMDNSNSQSPICYYRLKQTDFDGTTKEIGLKVVRIKSSSDAVSVYPNPF